MKLILKKPWGSVSDFGIGELKHENKTFKIHIKHRHNYNKTLDWFFNFEYVFLIIWKKN